MPTVDDLTISLTIKDNSNLDKLRKNLDSLIKTGVLGGAGGGAIGGVDLKQSFEEVKREIDYLKGYIVPARTGTSLTELSTQAGALLKQVKDFNMEDEIAAILAGKRGSLESIVKDYQLESVDDVEQFLLDTVGDLEQDLMEVMNKEKTRTGAFKIVNLTKEIFANLDTEMGLGRTLLSKYMRIREEEDERIKKFLTKIMGDDEHWISQFKLARLKKDSLTKNKQDILDKLKEEMADIDPAKMKQVTDLVKNIPGIADLEVIFDKLGFKDINKGLFDPSKIADDEGLRALAFRWLELLMKEEWDPDKITGSMGGFITFLNDRFNKAADGTIFKFQKKLDFILLGPFAKKVLELLNFKNVNDALIQSLEPKGGGAGDLFKEKGFYAKILDAPINVLTTRIKKSFDESESINVAIMKTSEILKEIGAQHTYHVEEMKKIQDEAHKQLQMQGNIERVKELTKDIKDIVETILNKQEETDSQFESEQIKAVYSQLSEIMKMMGLDF